MIARPRTKNDLILAPTIVAMAVTIERLNVERRPGLLKPIVLQRSLD
jgi:hypothetical protein